jgi:hypothetical protein
VTRAQGGEGGWKDTTSANSGGGGAANLGGGGGGGSNGNTTPGGANGGSGVVIIAYPDTFAPMTSIGVGLTYSVSTVSRAGYRVYTFTAGTDTVVF